MPELPEVETVKETLKQEILNKVIKNVTIYYKNIIEYPSLEIFQNQIINQKINDIKRRGKWLIFELDDFLLLSHLRMEGKYFLKDKNAQITKHDHISFELNNQTKLIYNDTRKFGRMYLYNKNEAYSNKPLNELGLEPWDSNLNIAYLKQKYKTKKLPIKTVLLDQTIIVGIGNIYADEILFLSKINPYKKCCDLNDIELQLIIKNTQIILEKAIKLGGTTIKSYTSKEGVHGRFQNELLVHTKTTCPVCQMKLEREKIGGRSTYYCNKCQKN